MMIRTCIAMVIMASLAACATNQAPPDYAAKNRPLEERCARVQADHSKRTSKPGLTRAEVQAEARAAAARGELDKACDWL